MKTKSTPDGPVQRKVAFLWDESLLWGLMAYKAIRAQGLSFDFIRSSDIRQGKLEGYRALFVPGGWAAYKIESLGEEGVSAIRQFVGDGGNYLGICGGAGLATANGLGLLGISRKPGRERVPSFSGRMRLDLMPHSLWDGLGANARYENTPDTFHAWWPSQFVRGDGDGDVNVKVLAKYKEALPDSFSADLNVGDVTRIGGWDGLEAAYGINLDPARLYGEPAVVEGMWGKGRVVLSLIHFDTPGDANGGQVMKNLWDYLGGESISNTINANKTANKGADLPLSLAAIEDMVSGTELNVHRLIQTGIRNFLWFWRNDMLLQWRRGVRGLEYCTLYVMIGEVGELIRRHGRAWSGDRIIGEIITFQIKEIQRIVNPFVEDAATLITMERLASQSVSTEVPATLATRISALKSDLFSDLKRHGGRFKTVIDEIDKLLILLLEEENRGSE